MPKYSTGSSGGGGDGGACELCGSASDDLRDATVAGAELQVCANCAPHGEDDDRTSGDSSDDEQERRRRAAQQTAAAIDAVGGDSSHWEEKGTNYDRDQLPYLYSDYGERVVRARQDAGLQRDELAAELEVDENDLLAVEQGRATQADVGGSIIFALEERLGVDLARD